MKFTRLSRIMYDWENENGDDDNSWVAHTKRLLAHLNLNEYRLKQKIRETTDEWNKLIHDKIQETEQKEQR